MIYVYGMQKEIVEDATALEARLVVLNVEVTMTICKHNINSLGISTPIPLDGLFCFIQFSFISKNKSITL